MADPVRLSAEEFQRIYEKSFRSWSLIYHHVTSEEPTLPRSYFEIQNAFRQHPFFPPKLQLKHFKYPKHSQVYATGRSSWDSGPPQPGCKHELPVIHQEVQIPVALSNPLPVSVAATPDPQFHWESWFARGDDNYLAVLA